MPLLSVSHVSKAYPGLPVLHDISFGVDEGETVCLLGPSGCGKTTLLHIIAGLEQPDAGAISFAGQDLLPIPVHRRHFGLMFQDFALFPHLNVFQNVAFGLRMQGRSPAEVAGRVRDMLTLVRLSGYEGRRVTELSGGEQQRVALARSLAPGPQLLMLDEPLGALDRTLREELMNELRAILKRVGVTALYVTHDQNEAFAVADRIIIMRARPDMNEGGHVEQVGTPRDIYLHPATRFVAAFLGFHNLLAARMRAVGGRACLAETRLGTFEVTCAANGPAPGSGCTLLLRPEAASLPPAGAAGPNLLSGQLLSASFRGSHYLLRTAHLGGAEFTWEMPAGEADLPAPGSEICLALDPAALSLLPGEVAATPD